MARASERNRTVLDNFIEEIGMDQDPRYVPPTAVYTTIWGVDQYGWSGTCSVCKAVWCVRGVIQDKSGLRFPECRNKGHSRTRVYADNAYICSFQKHG